MWVRALKSENRSAPTWSASTLSRTWTVLDDMKLIRRERHDRLVLVRPRREDGRADYIVPGGREGYEDWYFVLPDTFWTEDWFGLLSLPALAVLLVIAKETNSAKEVRLTHEQFELWYGINRRTAGTGLRELESFGLLHVRKQSVPAALSATGRTIHHHYSLTGDFGYEARRAAQRRAKTEAAARAASTAEAAPKKKPKKTSSKTTRRKGDNA